MDFLPISDIFQDVGHAIKAGDPRIRRIDVSIPGFLAREDIVPARIPLVPILTAAVASREETASLRLSLEEEIDQFRLEEEEDQGEQIICISDAEDEPDRFSGVHDPILVVACPYSLFEEEEEGMSLNQRKGLRDLLAGRNEGSTSKEVPKSHTPNLPLPPPPPTTNFGLLAIPNLKKKRKK